MRLLELARKNLFWTVDFVKGGNVRSHYNDIKDIQENCNTNKAKLKYEKHLQKILTHSLTTVPFYNKESKGSMLQDFPVINKEIVRGDFGNFKSEKYKNKKTYRVTTSGSTGNPFNILHDKNKRDRNTADTIYFAEKTGFNLGSRLCYLRLWDKQYRKSNLLSWIQNIHMHSVDEMKEEEISGLLHKLEKNSSRKNILAYTSALHTICKYLDAKESKPLQCNIVSVITIAEGLNDYVRQGVKKYFDVEAVSRYSNSENGIIAQQEISSTDFVINRASYVVELLDLNLDEPAKLGETGRIVITDLFNYSMPLIRYDTGDLGILNQSYEAKGKMTFSKIEGRKMDMFTNTKGEYISSHIIHHILQYDDIEQFQFIEDTNGNYIIKLKVTDCLNLKNEERLINQYREYFGEDANIRIEYVNEIPLLSSGKRKLVINNAIKH